MSARKLKVPTFTEAERAILEPLMVKCLVACVEQARLAPDRYSAAGCDPYAAATHVTDRAGQAFDLAIAKLRGGK